MFPDIDKVHRTRDTPRRRPAAPTNGRRPRSVPLWAAAFGALTVSALILIMIFDPADWRTHPAQPSATPLPTATWASNGAGLDAQLVGTLRATRTGCLYAGHPGEPAGNNSITGLVWPPGWSMTQDSQGVVEVIDDNGAVALRENETFTVRGGIQPGQSNVCGLDHAAVFIMMDFPQRGAPNTR